MKKNSEIKDQSSLKELAITLRDIEYKKKEIENWVLKKDAKENQSSREMHIEQLQKELDVIIKPLDIKGLSAKSLAKVAAIPGIECA